MEGPPGRSARLGAAGLEGGPGGRQRREGRRGRHGESEHGTQPWAEVSEHRASPPEQRGELRLPRRIASFSVRMEQLFRKVLLLFVPTFSPSHVESWDLFSRLEDATVMICVAFIQGPSTKSAYKIVNQIVKLGKSSKTEFYISVNYEVCK